MLGNKSHHDMSELVSYELHHYMFVLLIIVHVKYRYYVKQLLPLGFGGKSAIINLIVSSRLPYVGEGTTLSHIINISVHASTAWLW